MNITIIGAGNVGRALGQRWAAVGHSITYAVRDPDNERHHTLLDATPNGRTATPDSATTTAEVVVIALPWDAAEIVARDLTLDPATIVIDATNALLPDFSGLDPTASPSGGELIAGWTGSTRVVKAFNTTGAGNMNSSTYPAGTPAMPIAGDETAAKSAVADLATAIGFDPIDCGPLSMSRTLEHLALLWIRLAYTEGNGPNIAYALLRRG